MKPVAIFTQSRMMDVTVGFIKFMLSDAKKRHTRNEKVAISYELGKYFSLISISELKMLSIVCCTISKKITFKKF